MLGVKRAVESATNESPRIDYTQIGFLPLLHTVRRMNQSAVTSYLLTSN